MKPDGSVTRVRVFSRLWEAVFGIEQPGLEPKWIPIATARPLYIPQENALDSSKQPTGDAMPGERDDKTAKSEILQGTLDLMVLKTLDAMGSMHGYGLARRIEQISEAALQVNQGTIYLCLIRLVQKRWIVAEWGTSENNRRAKFYSISKSGRRQLEAETKNWERVSGVIGRLLTLGPRQS
jgi:PadR family transcriptional regulator, regulatory protein PadR